jgi:hypothetical protein
MAGPADYFSGQGQIVKRVSAEGRNFYTASCRPRVDPGARSSINRLPGNDRVVAPVGMDAVSAKPAPDRTVMQQRTPPFGPCPSKAKVDDQFGDFAAGANGCRVRNLQLPGNLARAEAVGEAIENRLLADGEGFGKQVEQLFGADLGEEGGIGTAVFLERGLALFVHRQRNLTSATFG